VIREIKNLLDQQSDAKRGVPGLHESRRRRADWVGVAAPVVYRRAVFLQVGLAGKRNCAALGKTVEDL